MHSWPETPAGAGCGLRGRGAHSLYHDAFRRTQGRGKRTESSVTSFFPLRRENDACGHPACADARWREPPRASDPALAQVVNTSFRQLNGATRAEPEAIHPPTLNASRERAATLGAGPAQNRPPRIAQEAPIAPLHDSRHVPPPPRSAVSPTSTAPFHTTPWKRKRSPQSAPATVSAART